MKQIIGIDLGTTNSLVCVWKDGKAVPIPNAFGEYLTPSVVGFDDEGKVYVGKAAKERLATHPNSTFEFFKRSMGTNTKYGQYTPEELSSFVLRSLKEDARRYLGEPVDEAVISVPAYFNDKSRNATKNAGYLAGLKVERIINEPSAAALGYLRGEGVEGEVTDEYEEKSLLVFDFGGGTLDVSMVETFDNVVEIIAVSGDNMLGGIDFDKSIALHFLKQNGKTEKDVSAATFNLITESAEAVKRELTEQSKAIMHVRTEEISGDMQISNRELVTICSDVLKRLYRPIEEVLNASGKELLEITDVVLVGGSSKMPIVKHYLEKILERDDIKVSNPDYMIALGMGVYVGIKERDADIKNIILTDVCPFSLGVSVHNHLNADMPLTSFMIPRNTALPVSKTNFFFPVHDNQESVRWGVYQGENRFAKSNKKLGELVIKLPPGATTQTCLELTFTYDLNGILVIDAFIPEFNIRRQDVIVDESSSIKADEMEAKLKELEKVKMLAHDEQEDSQIIEWALKLYSQYDGVAREELGRRLDFFMNFIKNGDMYQKVRVRNHFKKFLLAYQVGLNKFNIENNPLGDSWLEEEDKMIEKIFEDWNDEQNK